MYSIFVWWIYDGLCLPSNCTSIMTRVHIVIYGVCFPSFLPFMSGSGHALRQYCGIFTVGWRCKFVNKTFFYFYQKAYCLLVCVFGFKCYKIPSSTCSWHKKGQRKCMLHEEYNFFNMQFCCELCFYESQSEFDRSESK